MFFGGANFQDGSIWLASDVSDKPTWRYISYQYTNIFLGIRYASQLTAHVSFPFANRLNLSGVRGVFKYFVVYMYAMEI